MRDAESAIDSEFVLPLVFEPVEELVDHFPPAADSSAEALLNAPWRAYTAFTFPDGVVPHPSTEVRITVALQNRDPLAVYREGLLFVDFALEEGHGDWVDGLVEDVVSYVERSCLGARLGAKKVLSHLDHEADAQLAQQRHLRLIRKVRE